MKSILHASLATIALVMASTSWSLTPTATPSGTATSTASSTSTSAVQTTAITQAMGDSEASSGAMTEFPLIAPYTARYSSQYDWGWFSFDIDARQQMQQVGVDQWKLTFRAEASAATIRESSTFRVVDQAIQPLHYTYKASGLVQEDDQDIAFDHQQQTIRDRERDRSLPDKWQSDLHDKLSYMQQLSMDLALGKQQLSYHVFEKGKVKEYRFDILGTETIDTRMGPMNTVKIRQRRDDKRDITAWLAVDKGYLLVKLVDRKKGKKQYQINLVDTSL